MNMGNCNMSSSENKTLVQRAKLVYQRVSSINCVGWRILTETVYMIYINCIYIMYTFIYIYIPIFVNIYSYIYICSICLSIYIYMYIYIFIDGTMHHMGLV